MDDQATWESSLRGVKPVIHPSYKMTSKGPATDGHVLMSALSPLPAYADLSYLCICHTLFYSIIQVSKSRTKDSGVYSKAG
jgi:hypothetical protein